MGSQPWGHPLGNSLQSQLSPLSAGPVLAVPRRLRCPPVAAPHAGSHRFRCRPARRAPLTHRDQDRVARRRLAAPARVPGVSRRPREPLVPRRLQSVASDLVAPPVGYDRGSNPSLADGTGAPRPGGRVAGRTVANQVWWLEANPFPGLPPSLRSAEAALGLERNFIAHHVKAGPGELVRHRLPRHHGLALGLLAFVIDLGPGLITDRHVGRLDEGPG